MAFTFCAKGLWASEGGFTSTLTRTVERTLNDDLDPEFLDDEYSENISHIVNGLATDTVQSGTRYFDIAENEVYLWVTDLSASYSETIDEFGTFNTNDNFGYFFFESGPSHIGSLSHTFERSISFTASHSFAFNFLSYGSFEADDIIVQLIDWTHGSLVNGDESGDLTTGDLLSIPRQVVDYNFNGDYGSEPVIVENIWPYYATTELYIDESDLNVYELYLELHPETEPTRFQLNVWQDVDFVRFRTGNDYYFINQRISLSVDTIPEPRTYLLTAIGLLAVGYCAKRKGRTMF